MTSYSDMTPEERRDEYNALCDEAEHIAATTPPRPNARMGKNFEKRADLLHTARAYGDDWAISHPIP